MAPTQTQTQPSEGADKKAKTRASAETAKTPAPPGYLTPGQTKTSRQPSEPATEEGVIISPTAFSQNPFITENTSISNAPGPKNRFGTPRVEYFTTKAKKVRKRNISFGSVETPDEGTVYQATKELGTERERTNFALLKEVAGPYEEVSTNEQSFSDGRINPIACRSIPDLLKLAGHQGRLIDRLRKAIELGSKYVQREVIVPSPEQPFLTKPAYRLAFKRILDILDELLTLVVKYESGGVIGYGLEEEIYELLEQELAAAREEVYEKLSFAGKNLRLPQWGKDGNTSTLWNENDFEILGAVFRLEVEAFLTEIGRMHEIIPRSEKDNQQEDDQADKSDNARNTTRTKLPIEGFSRRSETIGSDNQPSSISRVYRPNALTRVRTWNEKRRDLSVYGHPTDATSGRGFQEMFERNRTENPDEQSKRAPRTSRYNEGRKMNPEDQGSSEKGNDGSKGNKRHMGVPDGGPPDDDDNDEDGEDPKKGRDKPIKSPLGAKEGKTELATSKESSTNEPRFDNRLKVDIIPTWDGEVDNLGRWVHKINRLSQRSQTVFEQLGHLVPLRLTGSAEVWYYSQSPSVRSRIETDWSTLRDAIGAYYMNRTYMDRQKARANRASYRDHENPKETPSEYFIRKLELVELVYEYSEIELINEIMSGAPAHWVSILTPHLFKEIEEFQLAVKFHEENLLRLEWPRARQYIPRDREGNSRNPFNQYKNVRTNAVGWSKTTVNPPFPKDDSNVSPKNTPEDVGARPCRHCGSAKHWDPECKYARKGEKRARVNKITLSEEDVKAQEDYDLLFDEQLSEDSESEKDF